MVPHLYALINAFALLMIGMMLWQMSKQRSHLFFDHKLFACLACSVGVMLVFDTGMWLFDGVRTPAFYALNTAATLLYYMCSPAPVYVWALYVHYRLYEDEQCVVRAAKWLLIPMAAGAALSVWSLFEPVLFTIDAANVYHRGPYFMVMAGVCLFYFLYTLLLMAFQRETCKRRRLTLLLLVPLPPVLGSIAQILFYGVSVLWICTTLSVLILFISMQNTQINTDYLTRLYNKRQFDSFFNRLNRSHRAGKHLACIMVDIDDFKKINDQYGHVAGDQAIVYTSRILKESVTPRMMLTRYAGDEFAILFETDVPGELKEVADRIRRNLKRFNSRRTVPYRIGLSIGCEIRQDPSESPEEFLRRVDGSMYEQKEQKRKEAARHH